MTKINENSCYCLVVAGFKWHSGKCAYERLKRNDNQQEI
jgi:hypothetical protein